MHRNDRTARGRSSHPPAFDRRAREGGLWGELRERAVVWDLVVLAAVPALLLGAYALPDGAKWRLALDYTAPTLVTAFASHFVHFSSTHLLVNLASYLLVVPTGYALSVMSGRRRTFFVVFTSFLLSFPFLLSGLNLLFPRSAVGVGFSGVLLAFVGYLPFAFMGFVGSQLDGGIDAQQSHWLFFLGLAVVAYMAAPGIYGPGLAAAAALAGVRYFLSTVESIDRVHLTTWRTALAVDGYAELALLGGLVFLTYPFVAFPSDLTLGSGVLNVYTHALGFCLGYIATYVTSLSGWLDID